MNCFILLNYPPEILSSDLIVLCVRELNNLTHILFSHPTFLFYKAIDKVVIGAVKCYWRTIYPRTRNAHAPAKKQKFHNLENIKKQFSSIFVIRSSIFVVRSDASSLWDFARLVVSNLCFPLHNLSKNVSTFSRSFVCIPPLLILT